MVQMKWFSQSQIAKILSVVPATVARLIDDGELGAINIARRGSVRKRYRVSEKHLADFQVARANKVPAAKESKSARRTIARPTKDYFAPSQAGGK